MLVSSAAGSTAAVVIAGMHVHSTSLVFAPAHQKLAGAASGSGACRLPRTRSAARSPDRTDPSMVAGKPVSVQSPARNRFFRPSPAPAAARSAPASPQMWHGARARSARAAIRPATPRGLADVAPDRLRQLLARHVDQPVAIADGDREPLREGKQPFHEPADHAEDRPASRGGSMRKCALTMARNFVGVFRPGSSAAAGRGGTASTTASSAPSAILSSPKFSSLTRSPDIASARSSCPKRTLAPLPSQQLDRGLDQHRAQAVARDQRTAGLAARQQRFAHDRAGKARPSPPADRN